MLVLCLVAVVCLAVAYILQHHNVFRKLYLSRKLPGPPALPIIGNALMFVNQTAEGIYRSVAVVESETAIKILYACSADNFASIVKAIADYGQVCRIWIGSDLNVFLTNPADVDVGVG